MEGKMNMGFALRSVALLGRNLYVGTPEKYSTIDTDDIVTYASKAAGVTKSCMMQTFIALYDAFEYFLCNGHSFKVDGLGTFSLSMSATSTDPTAANTVSGADAIKAVGINFLPDKVVKSMLTGIAWNSVITKNSALQEFTEFVGRRVILGSDSCNILNHDASEAHSLKAGDVVTLYGYNCPDNIVVKVDGLDASEASASEEFTLALATSKTKTQMVATAKATKTIATVQKITVNGVEYEYTGTSNYVTAKAGSHIINNGSSFEAGSYALSFSGKDLSSLAVTLDGNALSFVTKTSTSAVTASMAIAAGSHTLIINGSDERTFTCAGQAVANVSSLSCNGITVNNGGSSSMINGTSYTMVANGQNLNLITADKISLPSGSTISGYTLSANNTKLQFVVTFGGVAGAIKLGDYFTVNVTVASSDKVITSIGGISSGGTVEMESDNSVSIIGGDLTGMTAKLTNASTGVDMTSYLTFSTAGKYISVSSGGTFNLVIYRSDGSTADWTGTLSVSGGAVI